MPFHLLLNLTPPVKPVYDDRAKAMEIMIVIICFLIALTVLFLYLWLTKKPKIKKQTNETQSNELSQKEQDIINKYRTLKDADKNTIENLLNALNNQNKE